MSIITRMRKKYAVYWSRLRDVNQVPLSSETGVPLYNDPIEMRVRWDEELKQINTPQQTTITSVATVYTDRSVQPGDLLWYGRLSEAVVEQLGQGSPGVFEVKAKQDIDNLRGSETLHVAYL